MIKKFLFLFIFLIAFGFSRAENLTMFTGVAANKTELLGASLGGDIWHFLQIQFDIFKYLEQDQSLYSSDPEQNRGDFLGISLNFALKIPIHLIPYLDKLDFIQPYVVTGYGFGLENLAGEYIALPDVNGKTGIFNKIRQFDSFGYGLIIMVVPKIGIKIDYRSIKISELKGMGYTSRKFARISFGICL